MSVAVAVGAGLKLATEVLKLVNTKVSRKYIDRSVKIQLEIEEQERRGYEANDALIEKLHKEYEIILGAANQELALYRSKK